MPDPHHCPRPIFASRFDATVWGGEEVFSRGENDPVTLPEYGPGEGIHLDAVDFLTGFATTQTIGDDLGGTNITVTINSDDRIEIANTDPLAAVIVASPDNAVFGLPTDANVVIASNTTYTAPKDWQRGPVFNALDDEPPQFQMTLPGFGFPVGFPLAPAWVQSVPMLFRGRGDVGDLDDVTGLDCLEELDNIENDSANGRIRWAVIDGHVVWSCFANVGEIDWISESFRDRLGFDGTEALLTTGVGGSNVYYQRANKRLPGWVAPSRPLSRLDRRVEVSGSELRLQNGSYSTAHFGSFYGWEADARIDGPNSPAGDLTGHYLDFLAQWARPGMPVTLYQGGDTRRGPTPESLVSSYDLSYTAEPYHGRLVCSLHPDTGRDHLANWDNKFRITISKTIVLADREDGV